MFCCVCNMYFEREAALVITAYICQLNSWNMGHKKSKLKIHVLNACLSTSEPSWSSGFTADNQSQCNIVYVFFHISVKISFDWTSPQYV